MVEDKKYMVSEDELVKLASKVRHKSFNHIFEIYQFLNSKTPIEPSDDAKQILYALADNLKVIHQNQAGTPEQDQLMIDSNIFEALSKLPQPKPFNEAEIRKIVNTYLKHRPTTAECIIKELSTLTPKDNIKEYYDE